jgi:hypothetical protein
MLTIVSRISNLESDWFASSSGKTLAIGMQAGSCLGAIANKPESEHHFNIDYKSRGIATSSNCREWPLFRLLDEMA